jgi:hypothetical protein
MLLSSNALKHLQPRQLVHTNKQFRSKNSTTSPAVSQTSSGVPQATHLPPITKENITSTSSCTSFPTSAAKNPITSGHSWPRWMASSVST